MTDQEARREKFDKRAERSRLVLPGVLDFLMTVASNAGDQVEPPSFDGVEGVGITYQRKGTRFCRLDPKFDKEHVFAQIPGASRDELEPAGTLPDPPRQDDGWVKVENMWDAVRLVPLILRKYDNPSGPF